MDLKKVAVYWAAMATPSKQIQIQKIITKIMSGYIPRIYTLISFLNGLDLERDPHSLVRINWVGTRLRSSASD